MKYVVSVGGGLSSTLFTPLHILYVDHIPKEDVRFVIAKVGNEHPDVWRLIHEVERLLDIRVEVIGLGKTVWDIFHEQRFLGNSRFDNCSRTLKRDVMRKFMQEEYPGKDATLVLGVTFHEIDRELSIRKNWNRLGYPVYFPLTQYPELTSKLMQEACVRLFGFLPELYRLGFTHNNCGGACVKAGKRQWKLLLETQPETYAWWEENERHWREANRSDRALLREQRNGEKHYVTLAEFRHRHQEMDLDDTPGCSFCDGAAGYEEDEVR